jgi:PhnB protein
MPSNVKAVPEGFHSLTPHLTVRNAAQAIEFYKQAFGAQVLNMSPAPDGKKIMHATLKIGDSVLMLNDEFPEWGGALGPQLGASTGIVINLYLEDIDTVFQRAVAAGATTKMPPADMFWGDRYGQLVDPFGHRWALATHIKDMSQEEMHQAMEIVFAKMPKSA